MHNELTAAVADALAGRPVGAERAATLVPHLRDNLLDAMAAARMAWSGRARAPFTCGIVNAKSGRCQENCAFCAQSASHDSNPPVYPLVDSDELLRRAEILAEAGVTRMGMVTSGTAPTPGDFEKLCAAAERIRARVDIGLCASFGLLSESEARALRDAGFSRYHHNLETSRRHYPNVCTSHGYDQRVETVRHTKAAGLEVCSGGIFGIGEDWDDRIAMSEELAGLDVDSIPVNFLTPIPGTPLADQRLLAPAEALVIIAVYRLMHPGRDIVVCGGRTGLGRYEVLIPSAGANGLMVGDYLTTKGAGLRDDLELLATLGLRA